MTRNRPRAVKVKLPPKAFEIPALAFIIVFMISDELIQKIKDRLVNGFHPQRIILFGSQARGTADDRSDVDLLVICRFRGKRIELMVEMTRALIELDYAFDVVILRPEELERDRDIPGTIGRYAYKEGKIVYEQS